MKSLLCMALGSVASVAGAQEGGRPESATPPMLELRRAAGQPDVTGSAETFTGRVQISAPFQAQAPGRAGGATVRFDAAARTAWHTHPLGQTLVVTSGQGLVQQQGQSAQWMRVGDVVTIPPNTRHWHGAGPDAAMTHLAIAEKENGSSVNWQSLVSESDYQAAVTSAGAAPGAFTPIEKKTFPISDTLSAPQRAIPLIAALATSSAMPSLHAALHHGLDAGLTIGEAQEVLVQLYAYAGFPKSLNALGELMHVVQARQQRGLHDAPGREPRPVLATGDVLQAIGRANQTQISGGPVQGGVFDFAPVINQFLQAHLFGAIFERDNLDWQSRELATVGALAATPGAEAQLRSHMRASLRVGLRPTQLEQLVQVLADGGLAEAAGRAREALAQTMAATEAIPKGET